MDIVTHALMGAVLAAPLAPAAPLEAACLLAGTTLPDLDVLSRFAGKRAFLRCHQTVSHSLACIAALGLACGLWLGPWAACALAAGMLLHALTDASNTFGITLLWPFARRRISCEWVFFVDACVIAATAAALALTAATWEVPAGPAPAVAGVYGVGLLLYWAGRAWLRARAGRLAPAGTSSLLPSMLAPWRFLGVRREGEAVWTFTLDARDGAVSDEVRHAVLDARWAPALEPLPAFRLMRELSGAYHVVGAEQSADGTTTLTCRDLRTRHLETRFGQLDVRLRPGAPAEIAAFHV